MRESVCYKTQNKGNNDTNHTKSIPYSKTQSDILFFRNVSKK